MIENTASTLILDRMDVDVQEREFSHDLFRTVSELTTDGLAIIENGRFILVNDQLLETFHIKREQLLGAETIKFVHKDNVEKAVYELSRNRRVIYELRIRRGDGVYVYVELRAHPVLYKGNKCRLLILKDVTGRKINEKLFANYLNILDAFPQAISVHDKTGKILFSNRRGYEMIGLKPGELLNGMNVMELILPEYRARVKEDKAKIDRLEPVTGRFIKVKSFNNANPKSIEVSVIPVKWGEEPAIMTICHDSSLEEQIVKSEMAKQVLQSVNEHLQWEITEHRNLEAMLKRMVEEKEWMLKEVNHRVKNNLQIITSILNLQINQMSNKKLVPVMREFQNRFYALSSIFSSLYHTDANEEIDISSYLNDLTRNIFVSYSEPYKKISINCKTDRVFMEYDHAITCGLIVNELVSNSIKYAFPGDRTGIIKVLLKQNGKKMNLEVSDDGVGIKTQAKNPGYKSSLGLQLLDSLVTQLKNSTLKKYSGEKGTKYTITFSPDVAAKKTYKSTINT